MADFQLYWNPAKPYSTDMDQRVLYKKREEDNYTVVVTLPNYVDHYTVEGLQNDTVYDFQVSCDCGGITNTTSTVSYIAFYCPPVTTSRSDDTMLFSFSPGSATTYTVILYENGIKHSEEGFNGPFFGDISGSFTGLNNISDYFLDLQIEKDDIVDTCGSGSVEITCTIISDLDLDIT